MSHFLKKKVGSKRWTKFWRGPWTLYWTIKGGGGEESVSDIWLRAFPEWWVGSFTPDFSTVPFKGGVILGEIDGRHSTHGPIVVGSKTPWFALDTADFFLQNCRPIQGLAMQLHQFIGLRNID